MRPVQVTVGALPTASGNSIALTQTPAGAGSLTLNGALVSGGVAVLVSPAQITLTFAADETGHSFVVTGTDQNGSPITETIAGTTASTVTSVLTYATVTGITISAAATGAITAGNAQAGASAWVNLDPWALPSLAVQCTVSGTVNYTVQQTMDDPDSPTNPVSPPAVTWFGCPDTALVGATASAQTSYTFCPAWIRVILNSGSGSVTMTVSQSGNVPR
jgi:hypothetical protein